MMTPVADSLSRFLADIVPQRPATDVETMNSARMSGPQEHDEEERRWSRWMEAAQRGDRVAYESLLRELVPHLRRSLTHRTSGRHDVEDVVQEVLLTLHRVRATWDPARPFKPWLNAIARRRAVDSLRRHYRSAAMEVPLEPMHETIAPVDANVREEELSKRALRDAVGALPPRQRQAFVMLKLRELSLKQASAESGLSEGSLKVAVHRAMRALRVLLRGVRDEG